VGREKEKKLAWTGERGGREGRKVGKGSMGGRIGGGWPGQLR